jgi:hypothetical protein
MILLQILLLASTASPFVGEWRCVSAFESDPFAIELSIRLENNAFEANISGSTDPRFPDGPVQAVGPAMTVAKTDEWSKRSELMADVDQYFSVKNDAGDMSIQMLWDKEDGVTANLRQYYADRSPSSFVGGFNCSEKPS